MLAFFVAALVIQLIYWIILSIGLGRIPDPELPEASDLPVSVIVAARNEDAKLPRLLWALANQSHENLEVLIVNDASTDRTSEIVLQQVARDPRFKLVNVDDPQNPRKKHALALGIKTASHERLLFTDADCVPHEDWARTFADVASKHRDAVLIGYGPYRREESGINRFVRYETLMIAVMAAASTGMNRAFHGVGRNLSYPKSLFQELGGFVHQMHSLSGDDDLFIQHARKHGAEARYVLNPSGFVESDAPSSWEEWTRQKLRHTSAGTHYRLAAKFHLGLFNLTNFLVWLGPVFLGWHGAGLWAIRFLVQRAVLKRAAIRFGADNDLMIYQPILEFQYLLYNILIAPVGMVFGGRRW